jgi:hypothetical protein
MGQKWTRASFFLGNRWPQTASYAAQKIYVTGPIQHHVVLTRSTGCRQQASGKFISRKNEKLSDKQQSPIRKTGVFLMADVPKNLVAMSYKKTHQKINASLPRLLIALLAHTGW